MRVLLLCVPVLVCESKRESFFPLPARARVYVCARKRDMEVETEQEQHAKFMYGTLVTVTSQFHHHLSWNSLLFPTSVLACT